MQHISKDANPDTQIEFINKILRDFEHIDMQQQIGLSNREIVLALGTNPSLLHYKSLIVYYVIYNLQVFVGDLSYRIVNEIFSNAILKRYFVHQFLTRLTAEMQE